MKLSRPEFALSELLRATVQFQARAECPLPVWALVIEYRDGVWEVSVRGLFSDMRGVGSTFEEAWEDFGKAKPEELPRPPS
jgi:hypothetical protein